MGIDYILETAATAATDVTEPSTHLASFRRFFCMFFVVVCWALCACFLADCCVSGFLLHVFMQERWVESFIRIRFAVDAFRFESFDVVSVLRSGTSGHI